MRHLFMTVVGVMMSVVAYSASRSVAEAAKLAEQFVGETNSVIRRQVEMSSTRSVQLAKQYMREDGGAPALYVFNKGDNAGYVIVSADDRAEDILGYTDSGQFDTTTINASLEWWMKRYARQIASLADTTPIIRKSISATTAAISPLLDTKWAQEAPYYNQCPKDLITDSISMTGCVATAAAQIMKKWQYPEHGTGTHSYECCQTSYKPYKYRCQKLALKFDTISFDWANMRNYYIFKYSKQEAQAVATLMYACGVACNMTYSSDGSASYTDEMGYGLITYFGYTYQVFASACSRQMYRAAKLFYGKDLALENTHFECTTSELEAYLNSDLEAGRPVLMGGQDEENGGHEFVCDGRDSSGKFHINWGWSGSENGYYTLSALGKSYNFSDNIDMLIGLEPKEKPSGLREAKSEVTMRKWIQNGRLYIANGDHVYDAQGRMMY